MHRDNEVQVNALTGPAARKPMHVRLTRRALLKTAGQLSAGAIAYSVIGDTVSARTTPPRPTWPVATYDSEVAIAWFRLTLRLVKETPGFSPPVAARAFGYQGITLYEALVPGMPRYRSLAGQLNDLAPLRVPRDRGYHWPLVANSALAAITRNLFPMASPANQAAIDDLESSWGQSDHFVVPPDVARGSVTRGRAVAAHVAAWAKNDGGHEGYLHNFPTSYEPTVGPGLWQPTPPAYLPALQPYWGDNRPFVLSSGASIPAGSPPRYSTRPGSDFHNEAREVYETVNHLTANQRAIALFWSDDAGQTATPPGHCISILSQLLEARGASLETAAEAYAKVGMAASDALLSCWHTKYVHNLLRPISYIQQHIDPSWGVQMPLTTPPFPEYPSGHSVQTAAFASVMQDLFGNVPFTDHTHDSRGLAPRSFTSWNAMAEETAMSRVYGGIHFRSAVEDGVAQGTRIGRRVNRLRFMA